MPYPFNNVAAPDSYQESGTVQFPRPMNTFTVLGFNNSFYYRLLFFPAGLRGDTAAVTPDTVEHFVPPGMAVAFDESDLPSPGIRFAGAMFRNNVAGSVAVITVY